MPSSDDIYQANKTAASQAIDNMGGVAEAARKLETTTGIVWSWIRRNKTGVPLEYLVQVELLSGIAREELRRDVPWRERRNQE